MEEAAANATAEEAAAAGKDGLALDATGFKVPEIKTNAANANLIDEKDFEAQMRQAWKEAGGN